MRQLTCQKYIYKVPSKVLKKANWDLDLPVETARKEYPDYIVSLGSSQVLRWIDEIRGTECNDIEARITKGMIRNEKRKPRSRNTKSTINYLYKKLYALQFQPDYMCVIMNSSKDYDRANEGFKVNGISYRRLLGTNGGIKCSTIVYINEEIYPEIKKRIDNGRDMTKKLVPAKLEAYQALQCSGSTPIPQPKGVIVVNDCITHFTDDVIMINDEEDGEPKMTFERGFEVEHNDSDGYGLMMPSYSTEVNLFLTGSDKPLAGMNTRWAWDKGMLYTFDFVDFAKQVAKTYMVRDAWGTLRDVREADIILTTSMLKLWDSYDSWESYYDNCIENHYLLATPKITPDELESVRNTNYQFLQSYEFTDEELEELCRPTIEEVKGALGLDWRKSIVFMGGFGITEETAFSGDYDFCAKALMAEPEMINDPFIRRRIWNMINKRVEMGKRGAIQIEGNFAMISGDPYALAQSIFGLEVTGLLKAGEVYHKYWIDKGATEIACFRAPMTCHNNIRKMKLADNDETRYWFQYIDTALIFNAWDTACDAMNGADKDGDTNMCTDNPIILKKTRNDPTIMCVQRRAEKIVPTESDIIKANKLAFNDEIGTVTNYVTSMIERQAGFEKGSAEYNELAYRIKCGQLYQQNTIDRAKGIIAKPMPEYWFNIRKCVPHEDDDVETKAFKEKNLRIVANVKPYFMCYVYPTLRKECRDYEAHNTSNAIRRFSRYSIRSLADLYAYENKTHEMSEFLRLYEKFKPVGKNPCVINRMSAIFEREFDGKTKYPKDSAFDYTIMRSNVGYTRQVRKDIEKIYLDHLSQMESYKKEKAYSKTDPYEEIERYHKFIHEFKERCELVCSNKYELCDIVLDICYTSSKNKQFAWDVCGDTIIENLINRNGGNITIPVYSEDEYDFEYCGKRFKMKTIDCSSGQEENDDYTE